MVLSGRLSAHLFIRLSATSFWLRSYHCIIIEFSRIITIDKSDVQEKDKVKGQRSKSQR